MARIYFKSTISELENIFTENYNDQNILNNLHDELTHRTTIRAKSLREKIAKNLAIKPQNESSKVPQPPKPTPIEQQEIHFGEQPQVAPTQKHKQEVPLETQPGLAREALPSPRLKPQQPFPPITNQPIAILSSWTALEVLSPSSFVHPKDLESGDQKRIAHLNQAKLPWERGEQAPRNYRLYYQVVLGTIKLEPAVESLVQRYGDTRPERPGVRGNAALAIVVVDRSGKLVESPAIGISSFAWGVMCALKADLADLAKWPDVELGLIQKLERHLIGKANDSQDEDELRQRPLTWQELLAAFNLLVDELGLPSSWIKATILCGSLIYLFQRFKPTRTTLAE
jgi:hypothetical protein